MTTVEPRRRVSRQRTALLLALLLTLPIHNAAAAAPQQLACVLTDTADRLAAENRPIVVTFDEDKKTLQAQAGGQAYSFSQVSISTVSISGQSGNISLGIDRSSLGIVWQQYGPDQPVIEFGHCSPPGSGAQQ
jgi:hypothetical protein